MSAPGVGPLAEPAFRGAVDDPTRFATSRAVGAHLGLTPARDKSGETDIQDRISRCGEELARAAPYEAGPHAARATRDPKREPCTGS